MNWYVCKFKKSELEYPITEEYYVSSRRSGTIRGDDTDAPIYLCRPNDGLYEPNIPYVSNIVNEDGRYSSEEQAELAIEAWQESQKKPIDKTETMAKMVPI